MTIVYERPRAGAYIVDEPATRLSRESGQVTGGDYDAGTVLGKVTASGHYTQWQPNASDGSEVACAILYKRTKADEPMPALFTIALTAVNGKLLQWPEGVTEAQLQQATAQLRQQFIRIV